MQLTEIQNNLMFRLFELLEIHPKREEFTIGRIVTRTSETSADILLATDADTVPIYAFLLNVQYNPIRIDNIVVTHGLTSFPVNALTAQDDPHERFLHDALLAAAIRLLEEQKEIRDREIGLMRSQME